MAKLPSEIHGVIDYMTGSTLIALPRLLGLKGKLANIITMAGLSHITYSLLTRYELGALKMLPFKAHLQLDTMTGAMFAAAPLLFKNESGIVTALMAGIGMFELAVTAMSEREAFKDDWANELIEQVSKRIEDQAEQIREKVAHVSR